MFRIFFLFTINTKGTVSPMQDIQWEIEKEFMGAEERGHVDISFKSVSSIGRKFRILILQLMNEFFL